MSATTALRMGLSGVSASRMTSLEESDVGILSYISKLPGFRGILKQSLDFFLLLTVYPCVLYFNVFLKTYGKVGGQRYSDFIVNEVDLEGKVVHLTSMEAPLELLEEKEVKVSDGPNKKYDAEVQTFRALAGDSNADMLKNFIDQIGSGVDVNIEPIVLSPSYDKSHRTAMHNFFKEKLKFLVTDTIDGPDTTSKCIRVRFSMGTNHGRGGSKKRKNRDDKPYDSRGSDSWPGTLGKFLRFHLYKENKDTQEALGVIGKMLGVQPRSFGFAGTKDKRSVSTQRVTLFKQRASRLAALNERLIGIKIGDFCHVNEGLVLGQLHGNHFTITLRGVVAESEDTIKDSVNALGKQGFINYFGLQRFGSGSVPTHLIGATLLRGEWKDAVGLILDPREGEKEVITRVREYYKETYDIEGTLRQLPRHLVAEKAILQCLRKSPGNYLQALKGIPRTLRMMYVHSYQSYLWNHAASMRVEKYGVDQVVLGDLVYCKDQCAEKEVLSTDSECQDGNSNDTQDSQHLGEISEIDLPGERITSVKAVTEEDLVSGTYKVEDVVLPLPGSRVIYPKNDIEEVYHDLAKKDSISLLESAHSVKDFSITSMTGGYRRVFQKPKDFEWEMLTYMDGNVPLAETDLDVIVKSKSAEKVIKVDTESGKGAEEHSIDHETQQASFSVDMKDLAEGNEIGCDRTESTQTGISDGSGSGIQETHIALKLSFTLPASCYATMAIRELLKTSTSVTFHKTLNP